MQKQIYIYLVLGVVLLLLVVLVLRTGFASSLERRIIPDYPAKSGSLRDVLTYFREELAKQGLRVTIQVLDETGYDDQRPTTGIGGGNGYLFLWGISRVFDTNFRLARYHVVIIDGVGSTGGNRVKQGEIGSSRGK
jgi:hypothetical protein